MNHNPEIPVTLIVTPTIVSTNEQAIAISNENIEKTDTNLQKLDTVFLNTKLELKLDSCNTENTNIVSSENTSIDIQNNNTIKPKRIYNLVRGNNDLSRSISMSNDLKRFLSKNTKIPPKEFNILKSNSIYSKIPVFDQGTLGSCVSNTLSFVYTLLEYKQNNFIKIIPSRLFIYYNGRVVDQNGYTDNDDGIPIISGIIAMNKYGVCDERLWPYIISQYTTRPPASCYQKAIGQRIMKISYIRDSLSVSEKLDALRSTIVLGFPVIIGIYLFTSFVDNNTADRTGIIPMPTSDELSDPDNKNVGGHAVVLIGYNDTTRLFLFRNSWGKIWGSNGNGFIPYDYVTNSDISFDFYIITSITNPKKI